MEHDGRSYSHEVLEHCRFRSIELHKEGKKINDIADFFGIHRGSVSRWVTSYKRGGKNSLKSKKAPGPEPKLEKKDLKKVLQCLKSPATDFGFETPLWTCKRLETMIAKETKKRLHTSNVWRWLIKWNFSNQSPEKRALQADPKEGKKWLKEEWPKIQE